jgi:hypothetical protein
MKAWSLNRYAKITPLASGLRVGVAGGAVIVGAAVWVSFWQEARNKQAPVNNKDKRNGRDRECSLSVIILV